MAAIMGLSVNTAIAAEAEEQEIEEVVAVGQRLKGSAGAVLQERQNQAFVADIMGADQISRTGDGDAASALRRVTGLTLVDGKYIYVRGLGERYSSTQLNSMYVPSPDPTRSVVPLDLFPSDIIESLSVQKSFSPDMPAHFGGGNVNIRTKSIPSDFLFKIQLGTSYNTSNSDTGYFYSGGDDDWMGRDDGTRALPSLISTALKSDAGLEGDSSTTLEQRQALLQSLDWQVGPTEKDVDPGMNFSVALGDRFESEVGTFGVLAAVSYDNEWEVVKEQSGTNLGSLGCEDKCFAQTYDGISTEQTVRWSGTLNLGYEFNNNHLKTWEKSIPEDVNFTLMPATFKSWIEHAKVFYAAKFLGLQEDMHQELFDTVQSNQRKYRTVDSLKPLFIKRGVDEAKFDQLFETGGFRKISQIDQAVEQADKKMKSVNISGVPALIVNGKYKVGVSEAGGLGNMLKITNFLLEKERKANTK